MAETKEKRGWIVVGFLIAASLLALFLLWMFKYGVVVAVTGLIIFIPVAFLAVWGISHLIDWAFGGKR